MHDQRGLPVSTIEIHEIESINDFYLNFINQQDALVQVIADAEKYPNCLILQLYAATVFILSQSTQVILQAKSFLERAEKLAASANAREILLIKAIAAGFSNDYERAIKCYNNIIKLWPKDLLSALMIEFHCFEAGRPDLQLTAWETIKEHDRDKSYLDSQHFWASYAYALELNGNLVKSEEAAQHALKLNPNNPWAQHALAHNYGSASNYKKGIEFLESHSIGWQDYGDFVSGHNWFHLGLLYLENGEFDQALAIYKQHVKRLNPQQVYMHSDMIIFLWRLELFADITKSTQNFLKSEWENLSSHIKINAHEFMFPFLNITYVYALSRGGYIKEASLALEAMKKFADKQVSAEEKQRWIAGANLAEASLAFSTGDYKEAMAKSKNYKSVVSIGGSDEQRQIFTLIYDFSLNQITGSLQSTTYTGVFKPLPASSLGADVLSCENAPGFKLG